MNVLFDFHTVLANPFSGKFWNMTRFAECLSLEPKFSVHVIYDRPDGARIPAQRMTYEFMREKASRFHSISKVQLALLWERRLRMKGKSPAEEHNRFLTEIVFGHHSAPLRPPDGSVLHVDFQWKDLTHYVVNRMAMYERFHVLTHVQKAQLVSRGIEPDSVHVIPNCLDPSLLGFPVDGRDPTTKPYAVYVHGAGSDLGRLGAITPGTRMPLVMVGVGPHIPGSVNRLSWRDYVTLVSGAEVAICLTPSGDSTTTRLFEFAAMGVPFLAPSSRAMEELLPHGTYELSPEALARTCADRDRLALGLREDVAKFSYESTLPKLRELFH